MKIESEEHAVDLLKNRHLEYQTREAAIQYLAGHPTQSSLDRLVNALVDDEFPVRWNAAIALAQLGPTALPVVLRALTDPKRNTAWLREGVLHILHYSSNLTNEPVSKHQQIDATVFTKSGDSISVSDLMNALKGPAADIRSMMEAGKLLFHLQNTSQKD